MKASLSPHVLAALRCPHCEAPLALQQESAATYLCSQGHTFDQARQGYLTLLAPHATQNTADTLDMVVRRERFHRHDYYRPFAEEIVRLLTQHLNATLPHPLIADFGAGTGYYAQAITLAFESSECIALDLSKRALQRAKAPRIAPIVADTWEPLPLKNAILDGAINIFAPRNPSEFARVLKAGAPLIVSTPTPNHLKEIRSAADLIKIGRQDHSKREDARLKLAPYFDYEGTTITEFQLSLSSKDVEDLVMMGPNAYHTNLADLQQVLANLGEPLLGTFSVETHLFFAR